MDKITTINGILLGTQNDFNEHVENTTVHLTEEERDVWNAKADASSLSSKVDTAAFTAHETNAVVHITEEEREKWNKSPEMDADGNMMVPGNITAQGGMFSRDVTMAKSLNVEGKGTFDSDTLFKHSIILDDYVSSTSNGAIRLFAWWSDPDTQDIIFHPQKAVLGNDVCDVTLSVGKTTARWTLGSQMTGGMILPKTSMPSLQVGSGDDLNLYVMASGGTSAQFSIAEMRIYRAGDNNSNFHIDTGIGNDLYFERAVHFYDPTSFSSGVTMSQSLNVVGELTATENTTTLGNVITANIDVQKMNVHGPASFDYGVTIPMDPVAAGDAVNLANLPMSLFAPRHSILPLKSLWECNGAAEDTACGIKFKDLAPGGFGGICTRIMQWSDWAASATILTAITLTGGNGANVLIDAAYHPNTGGAITPTTSPNTAFLPNAVQLSLFETRQGTTITGRLVGVDGTAMEFSVPSQQDSPSCVYRVFLLETAGVIKFYLGQFTSGMFDGDADTLERPVYLGEMPVFNNSRRFCFLGIGGLYGGEGNSFPARIPIISGVCRYYGSWLTHLFPQK